MSQSIANEIQIESRERRPLRLDDILMNRWFLHTVYAIPMKCCRKSGTS